MDKRLLVAALLLSLTCSDKKKAPADASVATDTSVSPQGMEGGVPTGQTSVFQRGKNATKDAHFVEPTLTRANAARVVLEPGFRPTFNGDMWATPLYMENSPGGKGSTSSSPPPTTSTPSTRRQARRYGPRTSGRPPC
jgi:hypothetical protein